MKNLAFVLGLGMISVIAFSSCKKCTTCTYTPLENGVVVSGDSVRTEEVCETGKVYDNAITRYEEAGWVCE